jgi:serine/threonine protein kinase
LQQHQLEHREINPRDSLSIQGDAERQLVKSLVARYRALPAQERRSLPALLNGIAKLEVVAGDFEAAHRDFTAVVGLIESPAARAEAHFNAYQAALEQRQWPEAMTALREAATLDPERFAPFPLHKFELERILGAGGFGVAFLCRNRHSGTRVVLKTLRGDTLDRDVGEVFREARVLEELDHPAIIRVRDCDFADAARRRPYIVMDYFPGQTLAEHVEQNGALSVEELLPVARLVAEGLLAAHGRKILHRDVKPANLLLQRSGAGWQVKLIDFGLALPGAMLQSTARSQADRTVSGDNIAGTLDYAAPEQMGRLNGMPVAACSDVYGFGRTCCYALFATPQPTFQHWKKLPPELANLLGECVHEQPGDRPTDFAVVLQRLSQLTRHRPSSSGPVSKPAILDAQPAAVKVVRADEDVVDVLPVQPVRASAPRPLPPRRSERKPVPRRRSPVILVVGLVGACLMLAVVPGLFWVMGISFPGLGGGGAWAPPQLDRGARQTQPATEPPPKPLNDKELLEALKEWKTADNPRKAQIARRLGVTPAKKEHRPEVRKDLLAVLSSAQAPAFNAVDPRPAATQALGVWGTPDDVPLLIGLVSNPTQDVRWAAMRALAELKDERGIEAVARRWDDGWDRSQGPVSKCLIAFGPPAEKVVLPYLKKDHFTKKAACKVLEAIGTSESIEPLKELTKEPSLRAQAETVLAVIQARVGKRESHK